VENSDEIDNMEKSTSESDEIEDKQIKSIQIHTNEKNQTIFYKFSWRKDNMAYYKCMSRFCKGRAKASLKTDESKFSWIVDKFLVRLRFMSGSS